MLSSVVDATSTTNHRFTSSETDSYQIILILVIALQLTMGPKLPHKVSHVTCKLPVVLKREVDRIINGGVNTEAQAITEQP